jgi:hypothetical protein
VNSRRSETESYGEVGADPDPPTDQNPAAGSTKISAKKTGAERDQNLLLSSDDEFQ